MHLWFRSSKNYVNVLNKIQGVRNCSELRKEIGTLVLNEHYS